MSRVVSTPLDDFLNDASSATESGELLQRIGLFGSLFGAVLATGLVVFLASVHRGRHREVGVLLRLVALAGAAMLVGAAIEVAGVAAIADLGWADALADSTGSAPMMRFLGGLLIVFGLFDQTVPVGGRSVDASAAGSDRDDIGADLGSADEVGETVVRWIPSSASAFGLVGVALGVMSFCFDGHTVSKGPRAIHAAVNLAHVSAGGIWFGGIVGLIVVGVLRRSTRESTAPDIVRFSSIATVAVIVVGLAGALMTVFIIDGFGDLSGTDWGRLLLLKVAAVAIAAAIGGYNHFVVVPQLERRGDHGAMVAWARSTLAIEGAILVFVLAVTVFLTTASTN